MLSLFFMVITKSTDDQTRHHLPAAISTDATRLHEPAERS